VRWGKLLVMVMFGLCLVACAEAGRPIEVPGKVREGISAVLTAADPAVRPTFDGETCGDDPRTDPPEHHRWRMTATTDATSDELHAAGVRLGWQPERTYDGVLLLTNLHQFGEPVTLVIGDGTVRMLTERGCADTEMTPGDRVGEGKPQLVEDQADRLEDIANTVRDAITDIEGDLRVRPREHVSVSLGGPPRYGSCDAGTSTGAAWHSIDLIDAEVTTERDLAATSAALTDAVSDDWRARDWHADVNEKGGEEITLVLELTDGRANMAVEISYWGFPGVPDGVRLHISGAHTTCVPVSTP
jgi:hypothetical protein